MTSWLLAIAAVLAGLVGAAWLAFRKDRRAAHLGRIAGKLAGEPVDMTTRIWQDRSGRVMCENDPGRER